ncbi:MAG: response regulator [bacterium]|nr:response regulator [bacterium]
MAQARKAHVLLVDDEHLVRETLERMIQRAGYEVTVADSAGAALVLAGQQAFDILLTDVYMTGVPGDELVVEVLRLQPDILPLIITAYPDMDLAIRSVNHGARRFLVKPVSVDALQAALDEVLQQRQQELARERRRLIDTLLGLQEEAGEQFDLAAALGRTIDQDQGDSDSRSDQRILILCESLHGDGEHLRSAERYRHFRTIYRAQKAFNGQLQRAGSTASIRLAVISRAADLLHACRSTVIGCTPSSSGPISIASRRILCGSWPPHDPIAPSSATPPKSPTFPGPNSAN